MLTNEDFDDIPGIPLYKPLYYYRYDRSEWNGHIKVTNQQDKNWRFRINTFDWFSDHDRIGNHIWTDSFSIRHGETLEIPLDELVHGRNFCDIKEGIITVSSPKNDGLDFPSVLINKDGTEDPFIRID